MRTVTKLGAYGLAVAAAFAVAFAVLVTAPRTSVVAQTTQPTPDTIFAASSSGVADPTATPSKKAGDKVYIGVTTTSDVDNNLFKFSIDSSSDAVGTFTSTRATGNGKTLNCRDAATGTSTCDRDPDPDQITVEIQIDAESDDGSALIVVVRNLSAQGTVQKSVVIDVTKAATPTKLTAKVQTGWPTAIPVEPNNLNEIARVGSAADARTRGMTSISVKLEAKGGAAVALPLTITTTNALVFAERGLGSPCGVASAGVNSQGVALCDARTFDGEGTISVWGSGKPGVATVTFEAGGFTETVNVTLYGEAKKIEAAAEQNSVQRGGSVFIVATVTDGAGNPVSAQTVEDGSGSTDGPKAPEGDNTVAVTTDNTVDKDVAGTANDLPDCATGTNAKGKCVVQVTAPNPATAAQKATLGTHTVTLIGPSSIAAASRKVKVEITVAGAVDSITTDAPARVEPGSRTDIEVTIRDADGVLAGAQPVTATLVAGNGRVIGGAEALTTNGTRSFTYRAANDEGTAEFDIEVRGLNAAGDAGTGKVLKTESFTIEVGGEPAPEPPAQPTAAGIASDAPDRVEPGSSTAITVTVTDADGERAGMQSVTATQISGDGRVINGGPAATENGQYTFTFRAANTVGVAEIDVDARSLVDGAATTTGRVLATLSLRIQVGEEPAPPPPPPAPEPQPVADAVTADAPDRVEPGSTTSITVTVTDADGEPAGMQSVTATQISGDGRVINGGPAASEDGEYTFIFRAASTVGVAEIDVEVRALDENGEATDSGMVQALTTLTIQVGEPPAPAATLDPAPSGTGVTLTTFSGGTLSELQALLLDTCSSGSVAAYATARGGFVPFIPGSRIAAVNAAFMTAVVTDGMVPRTNLLVSGCD